MRVVILCGGQGMRLKGDVAIPKPLLEIGDMPILLHIMHIYARQGFADFVCCLGAQGDAFREYFAAHASLISEHTFRMRLPYGGQQITVTLAQTGEHAMTGARLKRIEHLIPEESFMVTYGDGLSDIDLQALQTFHESHKRIATVTAVQPHLPFGELTLSQDDAVVSFREKPRSEHWVNAGFFIFQRKIFAHLSTEDECILERTPLETLAIQNQLMAFRHEGFFQALDTYKDYVHLCELGGANSPWMTHTDAR